MNKRLALTLFATSAVLNIFLAFLILYSNHSKEAKITDRINSLEKRVDALDEEVFITPNQLQLSQYRVGAVIKDAKRLEGVETVVSIEPTTKISRQMFMQGLFYLLYQQFYGADKFSLENKLPSFRDLQWSTKFRARR